jgi:hypothetical protein
LLAERRFKSDEFTDERQFTLAATDLKTDKEDRDKNII